MFQKFKRGLAFVCALALILTSVPVSANAAAKPKFAKTYTSLYENASTKGVYTYKVKNLTKGQTVKWSVSGTGKSYVKLKKTSTKATSSTVSNTLTVKTSGKTAAKNKVVKLTAKIYSKAGKLQYTLTAPKAKIKVRPTGIEIQSGSLSDKDLLVGQSYQFNYKISPANATSTNVWSVTDENNRDFSSYINKAGVFTPKTEGTFTISVEAKIGTTVYALASEEITVTTTLLSAKQTAADKVVAVYSGDARKLVTKDSFTITDPSGAKIVAKKIDFSSDGKEVTVTTHSIFKDGGTYKLSDKVTSRDFTTRIGIPTSLKLLTTEITVNKDTAIEYGLYDDNGIEVSAAYPGEVTFSDIKIMNGELKDNKIHMNTIGDTGTFKMTYTGSDDSKRTITITCQVKCVAAAVSSNTDFTLTTSDKAPDFDSATYKSNRKAASGSNYYAHFRALDADGVAYKYDSITYASSDPDTLLVNNSTSGAAKVTAIKNGTVTVTVTAQYGKQTHVYEYEVTVAEPSYLSAIRFDNAVVPISNSYAYDYAEYINVTALDQYGEPFALTNETAQITDNSTYKANLATYDAANNCIKIEAMGRSAGTYNYTLTLTSGTHKASESFTVIVQTPPSSGALTYTVAIDHPTLDLALSADSSIATAATSKSIKVRVAEYKGGIFNQYVYMDSARIVKDGMYYSTDLTATPSSKDLIAGSGQTLTLTTIGISGDVCTKAPTGAYRLELKFYPTNGSTSGLSTTYATITLTDSQAAPAVETARTVANTSCKTALDLAKHCLTITNLTGAEIIGCTVTGSDRPGSEYALSSNESVNIKTVTIQVKTTLSDGKTVVSSYTVNIGKTLKNA